MRPDEGGCADLRRSLTAHRKPVRIPAYGRDGRSRHRSYAGATSSRRCVRGVPVPGRHRLGIPPYGPSRAARPLPDRPRDGGRCRGGTSPAGAPPERPLQGAGSGAHGGARETTPGASPGRRGECGVSGIRGRTTRTTRGRSVRNSFGSSRRIGALSMTPTLVRQHPHSDAAATTRPRRTGRVHARVTGPRSRSGCWCRSTKPSYERLEVGPGTRLLGLGCGSGLALLIAASRGARVTGVDADATAGAGAGTARPDGCRSTARAWPSGPARGRPRGRPRADAPRTTWSPRSSRSAVLAGDSEGLGSVARRGGRALAGARQRRWCSPAGARRSAAPRRGCCGWRSRLADRLRVGGGWRPALRDDLEDVAQRAGPEAGRLGAGGLPVRVRGHGQRGAGAAVDGAVRRGDTGDGPGAGGEGDSRRRCIRISGGTARCGCRMCSGT